MTKDELIKYLSGKIDDINSKYPNFISAEQKDRYIKDIVDRNMSQDDINSKKEEIDKLYDQIIVLRRNDENKTFGEVYKSYVIHVLKLYELVINDIRISADSKKQVFESLLNVYLKSKKDELITYLYQQISDSSRRIYGESELFLGSESLTFETVSNLYRTFVEDLSIIANDSEGKMFFTVPNSDIEFDNEGNLKTEIQYNFSAIKEVYDFAKDHGKQIKFHTFLWHNAVPENLKKVVDSVNDPVLKRKMVISFLKDYASKLASFINENKYDLKQIEVLNEIGRDEPSNDPLRDSWWRDILGDEYYIDVLKIVRESFPNTELIYNDYDEYIPHKCQNICDIVKHIKEVESREGIKLLDAIGLQAHYSNYIKATNSPLTTEMIKKTSYEYAKLGIPIYITEFDFNVIGTNKDYAEGLKQAFLDYYVRIANGLNMWGNSDHLTWSFTVRDGEFLNSHMVDSNGIPKPIYYKVMEVLGIRKQQDMSVQERFEENNIDTINQLKELKEKLIQGRISKEDLKRLIEVYGFDEEMEILLVQELESRGFFVEGYLKGTSNIGKKV